MLRRPSITAASLLVAFLAACPAPREEGLIVNVQTDYAPRFEFDHVRVQLDGRVDRDVPVGVSDSFTRPRFITTYSDAMSGTRRVSVALLQGTREVAVRNIGIPFDGTYLATVVLTRSCSGITCRMGESCFGARCVPDACVTGSEPSCPTPTCRTDAMCMSATACAHGECISGACFEVPTSGACSPSEACLPGMGCVRVESPDAPVDASSPADAFELPDAVDPPDAFTPSPSFTLHRLASGSTTWTLVTASGDFPTSEVEAAFTAIDGTVRVLTHTEIFTMHADGSFSARQSRNALFPELTDARIGAADLVGTTLTLHHGAHTTYTWGDTSAPSFIRTLTTAELPAPWHAALAPPLHETYAAYSVPSNSDGWALATELLCGDGVLHAYTEYLTTDGFGPRHMGETTYANACDAFVARRGYGEVGAFTLAGAPLSPWEINGATYAGGLWVFTSPE